MTRKPPQGLPRQGDKALRVASSQELLVRACGRRHIRDSPPRDNAPPLRFRTPQEGRRRAARRRELPEVAPDTRATRQRRGATFARLRMESQLYSLRASATRLTGKHWAAPYASSLLPRSWARARCGVGAFAPAPTTHVLAHRSLVWACDFLLCGFLAAVSRPLLSHCFLLCDLRLFVNKRMLLSCKNVFHKQ